MLTAKRAGIVLVGCAYWLESLFIHLVTLPIRAAHQVLVDGRKTQGDASSVFAALSITSESLQMLVICHFFLCYSTTLV